ncbi:MAG: uracil phosphoribosyltransferase [Desulfurococcales archaeon]|nr:uracil phosphoribosyltransferase [Desulfurococcales archaeon]
MVLLHYITGLDARYSMPRVGVMRVTVVGEESPLARWILALLRDKSTPRYRFRAVMEAAGSLLAPHVSRSMEWVERRVETPLGVAVELWSSEEPLVVGILGAAVPLVEGFTRLLPEARIGFVAARRVEAPGSVRVEVYYDRLPSRAPRLNNVILDPMLATGSTMSIAMEMLARRGAERVILGTVIASNKGIETVGDTASRLGLEAHVYTLGLDPSLDDRFFIVPGLGDAGDRALG